MAKVVLTDAYVTLNAFNVSPYITSVSLTYIADAPDGTTMGATTRTKLPGGLKDWTMTLTCLQDFALSGLDVSLFPLVGTSVPVEVRPTSGSRSTTNPAYTGNGIITSFPPLAGNVGAVVSVQITVVANGPLTRQTS